MFMKLGTGALALGLSIGAAGCFHQPPLNDLHKQAAKDFGCAPSKDLIDTRTEAKPVKMGSTQRMSIQGCGHKAIYRWDKDNDVWVPEPEGASANAK